MKSEFLGEGRMYQGGRSTGRWKPGQRVKDISQMPNGTILWLRSHMFCSENLAIVTVQRPDLPGVWARWANTDGASTKERDVFAIHDFILRNIHWSVEEYFLAEREQT